MDLLFTVDSPSLIIPQKALVAVAQTQSSKGEEKVSDYLTRRNVEVVTGGRGGFLWRSAWGLASPLRAKFILFLLS